MTLRISREDVLRFAEWSGDRNPLHVDPAAARATVFGRTVVHGMLSSIRALEAARCPAVRDLDIEFRGALFPDSDSAIDVAHDDGRLTVTVRAGDNVVLVARGTTAAPSGGPSSTAAGVSVENAGEVRTSPAVHEPDDLTPGLSVQGVYPADPAPRAFTAGPPGLARVLALASYVVGMELPGLRSLFTRATFSFAGSIPAGTPLAWRAQVARFDRRFRLLETRLEVATPDGAAVATGTLRSYVRFSPVDTPVATFVSRFGRERALAGRTALVTGGTRGVGADLTAALAASGCRVYASYHQNDEAAARFRDALRRHGLDAVLLRGDAGDPHWCSTAVRQIVEAHGGLDLLVLNACAPPVSTKIADASGTPDDYVASNLKLARAPLAAALPALAQRGGAVVAVSSSFVEEVPAGFADYVALKQAVEALAGSAVREAPGIGALVARPPRLRTAWNDTPTGVLGTIPSAHAAAAVVERIARGVAPGAVAMLEEFPAEEAPAEESEERDADYTVVLAASFTADIVAKGLDFWFRELEIDGRVRLAPYGQVLQTLLDPSAGAPKRGLNVVLLRVRDWLRELDDRRAQSASFVRDYLDDTARDLERALRTHRAQAAAETLLVLCPSGVRTSGEVDGLLQRTEDALAGRLDGLPGLQVVRARDAHDLYAVTPEDLEDPVREKLAHIPYRDGYLYVLATLVMREAHRRLSPPRKVVVVDCDNTLWRGVVGEAGPEGVELGAEHQALQERLAALGAAGTLVCLCSKNEEDDVWRAFEARPDFPLRREHVVAAAINWQPKSENIRRLASRLNLGLDSFIFIDDNPVECAEVRAACPEVLTIEWPLETAAALRLLEHAWELTPGRTTSEDARRTQMYREEFRRQELQDTLSFGDFIASLGLEVDARPLEAADLDRASQLTLRTNQFNFTTRRRSVAELQALADGGRHIIRTVRVRDRFGDYGLVGLVIAEPVDRTLVLDTFLLSCRVLGRGVEHQLAADLGRAAVDRGLDSVRLRIDFTKRNTPARKFLLSIVSDAHRVESDRHIECEVPAATLAELRFEPDQGPAEPIVENDSAAAAAPAGGPNTRAREAQVRRTAQQLASAAALREAIDGTRAALSRTRPDDEDDRDGRNRAGTAEDAGVRGVVYDAFAAALNQPVDRIESVDSLELLGCDSFKIVEITVALIERFPALPPTLLFEHRSVSEIVSAIAALSAPPAIPAPREAPAIAAGSLAADDSDIAVVGMHARCAGADSPEDLWELLSRGGVAVKPVPAERPAFLHPLEDSRPHFAGLLEDVARFDAELFGVAPREADVMDPQLRLFLEVAWAALEDAGLLGSGHEPDTGVFAGVMYADYAPLANMAVRARELPYRSWESFSLANRVSHLLGFRGPSLAVDTACSSSATALHFACRALRAGDCAAALVGGVNLILDPDRFVHLGRLGILSQKGRCLAFGAEADGTVLGEGAGAVVLRRLGDARRRGDRILGVIKSTGVSTGSGTVGFTAPNPQAQAEAIRRALAAGGIDPRTISYVETHGTGTLLGDPIEVRGLSLAHATPELRDPSLEGQARCTLGSIKPNIGHLEAGAGVLGLIKLLLQLQHRKLLPSVTSAEPNPQIPFADTPFGIQRALEDWTPPSFTRGGVPVDVPRRAALSSFGVGGSNVHVIVEEAPAAAAVPAHPERQAHALALSARNEQALQVRAGRMAAWLAGHPDISLADAFFSANMGRRHLEHRAAIVAKAHEDAIAALEQLARGEQPRNIALGSLARGAGRPKIAFLFTGQGSQHPGMGRVLYDTHPVFRDALDRCAAVFDGLLGTPLLRVLFAEPDSDDAQLLHQTGFTQPALFAYEYALARLWQSWGVEPDYVLGHSVGEIGAMCVAGGLPLEDALEMIAARGSLMQALPAGGAMASVMADEARVAEAIAGRDSLSIAAINGPRQIVISGDGGALAEVVGELTAAGIKATRLTVSHAFHSPLMRPMVDAYSDVLRRMRFAIPQVPLVGGVHGEIAGPEIATPEYWLRNVLDPVRFTAAMATLAREQAAIFLEIGPQPIMVGMGRQCLPDHDARWIASARKDADPWTTLLAAAGQVYAAGIDPDWKAFDEPWTRTRVSVPAYPFGGRRHWIAPDPSERPAVRESAPRDAKAGPREYEVTWTRQPPLTPPADASGYWVVLADGAGTGVAIVRALEDLGGACTVVFAGDAFVAAGRSRYQIRADRPEDLERLFREIGASETPVRGIVSAWAIDAARGDDAARAAHDVVRHAARLVQGVAAGAVRGNPPVWFVTRAAIAADGDESISPAQHALWGFGRTIVLEHPELWGGLIDLDPASAEDGAAIAAELVARPDDDQVALRKGARYVPRLVEAAQGGAEPPRFRPDAAYLVTGGTGAIGARVCRWLVEHGARHVIATSRRGEQAPGAADLKAAIERIGGRIEIVAADVSSGPDVDALLARLAAADAPGGIFHAAGIDAPAPAARLTDDGIAAVLRPKADAAWLLHERSQALPLKHFVCFSSIAAVLGSASRAHYAAANALADGLAHERRRRGLPGVSIGWGPWAGGGIATPETLEQFERIGNRALDPDRALARLGPALASGRAHVAIADIDWERFTRAYEARRRRPIVSGLAAPAPAPATETAPAAAPWLDILGRVPPSDREQELTRLLRQEVADTLGYDSADAVSPDRTFQDMGMDSLMSAEFAQRIRKRLGARGTALVFEHPRIAALAPRLLETIDLPADAPAEAPAISMAVDGPSNGAVPARPEPPAIATPIVGYSPEVEPLVYRFQEEAWPARRRDWIAPRWKWMFVDSARRLGIEPRVWLFRDNGRIAGHNGAIPVRVKIGGEERTTAWLVDTMVLEEYRSHAVGARLMVQAHEDLPFALSLGQTQQMREIQLRLGWEHVAPLQTAQFLIRPERVLEGKLPAGAAAAAALGLRAANALRAFGAAAAPALQPVEAFDAAHDRLWESMASTIACAVRRDASYLNWKYVEQPGQTFTRLELRGAGGVRGVLILLTRPPDDVYRYTRGFIVDLVAPLDEPAVLDALVRGAIDAAARAGADALTCLHIGAPLTAALRRAGFRLRSPERHLLVRPAGLDGDARRQATAGDAWFVTQGDSDIDRPW